MLKSRAKTQINEAIEDIQDNASDLKDEAVRTAGQMADTVSSRLKSAGVDTDAMVSAAKDKTTELQRIIADELQARPMRALGIAAAIGLVFGLMSR